MRALKNNVLFKKVPSSSHRPCKTKSTLLSVFSLCDIIFSRLINNKNMHFEQGPNLDQKKEKNQEELAKIGKEFLRKFLKLKKK